MSLVPVTPVVLSANHSFYRPFGYLPSQSDVDSSDSIWAIFGFAFSGAILSLVTMLIIAFFLTRHIEQMRHEFNQKIIYILLICSCFFVGMGLVSSADAVYQYPSGQSMFGHAFERTSIIGIIACLIPALFYRPFAARIDENTEHIKLKLTVGAVGLSVLALTPLTIASLCLGKIPFGLLLATVIIEAFFVCVVTLIGVFIIISVNRDQYEGLDRDSGKLYYKEGEGSYHTPTFQVGRRLFFLAWVFATSITLIFLSAFESPWPIYIRAGQTAVYIIELIIIVIFAWSHAVTILFYIKESGKGSEPTRISAFLDKNARFMLENGQILSVMEPIVKEGTITQRMPLIPVDSK